VADVCWRGAKSWGYQRPRCTAFVAKPTVATITEAGSHSIFTSQQPCPTFNNLLIACLWPDAFHQQVKARTEEVQAYVTMSRVHNVVPSFLLVVVGAFCACHRVDILLIPTVWVMAVTSAGIAISSMVVNDYFDWRAGVDVINKPDKPLCKYVLRTVIQLFSLFYHDMFRMVYMVATNHDNVILRAGKGRRFRVLLH
jgi:hypothetical protein